jgi:hypothetical protein
LSGFAADPESINGSVNLLAEIAALLYEGRLYRDLGTLCRVPHSHHEVATAAKEIATFGDGEYCDLVLLLIALATKLKETGQEYLAVDARAQAELDRVLAEGRYVPPSSGEERHGYLSA